MPRSANTPFSYSVPAGTAAVSGQVISSVAYNNFLSDITNNALNAAWPISYGGTGTTDGSALIPNGSAATPSVRFQSEPTSGIYSVSAGDMGISILGTKRVDITATGMTVTVPLTNTNTASVTQMSIINTDPGSGSGKILFRHDSVSPAAFDNLGGIYFDGRNGSAAIVGYADIGSSASTVTAGAESGFFYINTIQSGAYAQRIFVGGGLAITGAVGGDKGVGTINATTYYADGAQLGRCLAWVSFNGTGVVAINASLNVSSITDNGIGDWTVNFTSSLPSANYAPVITGGSSGTVSTPITFVRTNTTAPTASACRVGMANDAGTVQDGSVYAAFFN